MVLEELVQTADTFLDIGANIGFFSLLLAVKQPGLRVVAFEPNPKLYRLLQRNVALNGLHQIICEQQAISDAEGTAVLHLTNSDMSASLRSDFAFEVTEVTRVRTTTLDSYLSRNPPRGGLVIKIDVEGAELAAFNGARNTIAALQPDIIAEVAIPIDSSLGATLRECGYRFYSITDEGLTDRPALQPVVRENYLFLNYLLSTRHPNTIAELSHRIRKGARALDLSQTSKQVDSAQIRRSLSGLAGSSQKNDVENFSH
jgi:FkbM family methyltransferase